MSKQIPNSLITLILKYQDKDGSEGQATVRDIVTDIRHYCDEQGYDFSEVLEGATEVYEQETGLVQCLFTSEWDDGSIVTTDCKYDPETGYVDPKVSKGTVPTGSILREYITLPDGEKKEVCMDCHEYVLKTVVGDRADLSYGEMQECSNSECCADHADNW